MKYMVLITYLNGMIVGFPVPDNKVCVSTMHKIVEAQKKQISGLQCWSASRTRAAKKRKNSQTT
jgi:hypothetical protein